MKNAILFLLLLCAMAGARLVNVTTSNSASAIGAAVAGDTLLFAAGSYNISAPSHDGTQAERIVIKGVDKNTVIFNIGGEGYLWYSKYCNLENVWVKGDGYTPHLFHIKPGAKGYLTVRNCKMSGCLDMAFKVDFAAYNGPADVWPDYILVENCDFIMGRAGLWNNDGSDFATLRGNFTHDLTTNPQDTVRGMVYFSKGGMAYNVFENNLAIGARLAAFSFGGGTMGPAASMTSYRHDLDLGAGMGYELFIVEDWRSIARNNIVFNAPAACHTQTVVDCEFYNNTFINCTTLNIEAQRGGVSHNIRLYNNLTIQGGDDLKITLGGYDNGDVCVAENNTALGNIPLTSVFQNFKSNDTLGSDYRLKATILASLGAGRSLVPHTGWAAFYVPSTANYDYYGATRPNPPTVGATEAYTTAIEFGSDATPDNGAVLSVTPNPANPSTALVLKLGKNMPLVDVLVRDIRGRHVRSVYYGPLSAGTRSLRWDGRDHDGRLVPSGVYIFRASFGKEVLYKKFELVR